jgi:hypothetical protein
VTCFAEGAASIISTEYNVIVALLYAALDKASNHLKDDGEQVSTIRIAVAVPGDLPVILAAFACYTCCQCYSGLSLNSKYSLAAYSSILP